VDWNDLTVDGLPLHVLASSILALCILMDAYTHVSATKVVGLDQRLLH
jgi:hypothetical protein